MDQSKLHFLHCTWSWIWFSTTQSLLISTYKNISTHKFIKFTLFACMHLKMAQNIYAWILKVFAIKSYLCNFLCSVGRSLWGVGYSIQAYILKHLQFTSGSSDVTFVYVIIVIYHICVLVAFLLTWSPKYFEYICIP